MRRVCIIGAGVTGLTAGYDLARAGWNVDVLERWPGLGGQAATLDVGDGLLLERYYHHLFTSDHDIVELARELGVEIGWHSSRVGFFADGKGYPFTTPTDLLRFRPLPLASRIRVGLAVLALQRRHKDVGPLEHRTAHSWIVEKMGTAAWDRVWGPLLGGKFGDRAEDISMAWLWSKLTQRREMKGLEARKEMLGYPAGTFEPLFEALRDAIQGHGGRVLIDRPAAAVARRDDGFRVCWGAPESFRTGYDPRGFRREGQGEYDAVLATVPNGIFRSLLEPDLAAELAPGYMDRLGSIEYHAALCLLLELDRGFSPFYWTNVGDRSLPFIGLIEQEHLVGPAALNRRHFLYVANYRPQGDPLLELGPDELLTEYGPGLRRVNPGFDPSWVKARWLFREPDGQPIVTPGYRERMPPLQTGAPGLLLANTTQVYPEDRGTNYAVRLGRAAAAELSGARS